MDVMLICLYVNERARSTSSERIHRETGVNPVRSRHCDREFENIMPLDEWSVWEGVFG